MMLSEEARRLIEEIWGYLAPVVGPMGGATVGYVAASSKLRAEAKKIDLEGEAAQLDSITRHFQALIEGYEARVKDLTDEIEALRSEVLSLRKALDRRPFGGGHA